MNSNQKLVLGSIIVFIGTFPIILRLGFFEKISGLFIMGMGAITIFFPKKETTEEKK